MIAHTYGNLCKSHIRHRERTDVSVAIQITMADFLVFLDCHGSFGASQ